MGPAQPKNFTRSKGEQPDLHIRFPYTRSYRVLHTVITVHVGSPAQPRTWLWVAVIPHILTLAYGWKPHVESHWILESQTHNFKHTIKLFEKYHCNILGFSAKSKMTFFFLLKDLILKNETNSCWKFVEILDKIMEMQLLLSQSHKTSHSKLSTKNRELYILSVKERDPVPTLQKAVDFCSFSDRPVQYNLRHYPGKPAVCCYHPLKLAMELCTR